MKKYLYNLFCCSVDIKDSIYRGIRAANVTIDTSAVEAIYCDCNEKRFKCGVNFDSPTCDPSSGDGFICTFNFETSYVNGTVKHVHRGHRQDYALCPLWTGVRYGEFD